MPETMSPEGKQALEKWHQEQRDKEVVFDFQKELVEYCESDVRLLKQGCLTFKRLFESLTGFNPFDQNHCFHLQPRSTHEPDDP